MDTPAIIISIIYIIALTASVVPRSTSLEPKTEHALGRRFLVSLVFGLTQGLMAVLGALLGGLFDHLFFYIATYMVFAMMVIVAVRMLLESLRIVKGKMLFAFSSSWGFLLLAVISAMNTFLMALFAGTFLPFGRWFNVFVAMAGFLWAMATVGVDYSPKVMRRVAFITFSASVFMLVIAMIVLFGDFNFAG